MSRNFDGVKKLVVKVGTSVLTKLDGTLDKSYMQQIARQTCTLMRQKRMVIIVSSGAIGSGVKELGLGDMPKDIPTKQGAAAIGQSILMETWRWAFRKYGAKVAQLLLTYEAFSNRRTYLNLRNSMTILTERGVIPIINENDPISVHEIEATFGDNDKLSALVAAKIDAELLILLTDVNGLYDKNPRHKDAQLISEVGQITPAIEKMGGDPGSWRSKGGMRTKIEAAKIATKSNCSMVIANASEKNVLTRILKGEEIGTLFTTEGPSYTNKERWIRFSRSSGTIRIDKGAKDALLGGASLLPSGILRVQGDFQAGDIVSLVYNGREIAKGVTDYSSEELSKIKGKQAYDIETVLGYKNHDNVIIGDNLVLI